jgi:hypothetical protein
LKTNTSASNQSLVFVVLVPLRNLLRSTSRKGISGAILWGAK